MWKSRYILFVLSCFIVTGISAQKAERDFIRKGNRNYKDSLFIDAEVNYRKALEENPSSSVSMYNLGNTLILQNKHQDAMEQYQTAIKFEKDKMKLSKSYHNAGVLLQASKDYAKAIEVYKQALRNNPKDDETRYNLALCQKLLEDQQQDQQDQNQDQNQDNQDQQQEQKDQQQDQQQNQDQQQQKSQPEEQNEMSKENAEQMLNSVMQDEKDVQEKVKKQQQVLQGGRLEKNW